MSLAAKTALLTGGGRGSGHATSLRPAACGAAVVVNVFRNRETAETTAEAVRKHGVQACTVRANLGAPAAIDRLFTEIVAAAAGMDLVVSR